VLTLAVPSAADDPKSRWLAWYRFARECLDFPRGEAITYANVRLVEEVNRGRLRRPEAA
jgi:hypothetical protein